jgi:hypothetical protein
MSTLAVANVLPAVLNRGVVSAPPLPAIGLPTWLWVVASQSRTVALLAVAMSLLFGLKVMPLTDSELTGLKSPTCW